MNDPKLDEAVAWFEKSLKLHSMSTITRQKLEIVLTALSSLQEENATLREDKEMLDWCEKYKPNILCICKFADDDKEQEQEPIGYYWDVNHEFKREDLTTLREAIRNAMKGTQ